MADITESLIFSKELDAWRQSHRLTVTALSELLGVIKQIVSAVLRNEKQFSSDNLIKTKNILTIYDSMNTKTPQAKEDYAEQNASVLACYMTGRHARLLNCQSGLGLSENSGFVPGQSGVDEVTDIISALNDIANGDAETVKARLLDLVKGWARQSSDTVTKAVANPYGATRTQSQCAAGKTVNVRLGLADKALT